jgi:hypothetical protein
VVDLHVSLYAMPIFSASDFVKIVEWLQGNSRMRKGAIIDWLDAVYSDLEELSQAWIKLCAALGTPEERKEIEKVGLILYRDSPEREINETVNKVSMRQIIVAERLRAFYHCASLVLGGREAIEFHEEFLMQLGRLFHTRDEYKKKHEEVFGSRRFWQTEAEEKQRMLDLAELLQKEVASMQVTITTFKAKYKGR